MDLGALVRPLDFLVFGLDFSYFLMINFAQRISHIFDGTSLHLQGFRVMVAKDSQTSDEPRLVLVSNCVGGMAVSFVELHNQKSQTMSCRLI